MGKQGALFGGIGILVVLLGCIAGISAEYEYALNYGAELSDIEKELPVSDGLAWGYYAGSCPTAESIVASRVAAFLKNDGGVAAGLVRVFFHDCFVQGCDASILLKRASGSELNAIPNQTIRPIALQLINDIKTRIEAACPRTVSCADIVVVAAKQAVTQSGGPSFNVPLGRLDALAFSTQTTDLPGPSTTFAQQKAIFSEKGLTDTADLVALAGAHTLGVAHCGAFSQRILPTVDPKLNSGYAGYLKANVCPSPPGSGSTGLDFYSPNHFDNQYFKNLPTGGALLQSDQNLDQDSTAWSLVNQWASNQSAFFTQFVKSFVKMSQISSGKGGEIRLNCSITNSGKLNVRVEGEEPHVDLLLTTPTYTRPHTSEPELISMVTEGKADL
ncbi:unnamed protein product [Calypogeia fissa]